MKILEGIRLFARFAGAIAIMLILLLAMIAVLFSVIEELILPSEKYPHPISNFENFTLENYNEIGNSREYILTLQKKINKNESEVFLSKFNNLNKDRFDYGNFQELLFLRGKINRVNFLEISLYLNCKKGYVYIGEERYLDSLDGRRLPALPLDWKDSNELLSNDRLEEDTTEILIASENAEIDKLAEQVCSLSRTDSAY